MSSEFRSHGGELLHRCLPACTCFCSVKPAQGCFTPNLTVDFKPGIVTTVKGKVATLNVVRGPSVGWLKILQVNHSWTFFWCLWIRLYALTISPVSREVLHCLFNEVLLTLKKHIFTMIHNVYFILYKIKILWNTENTQNLLSSHKVKADGWHRLGLWGFLLGIFHVPFRNFTCSESQPLERGGA